MILKKEFYNRSALDVARDILGCTLARRDNGIVTKAIIVETEAYEGFDDKASHASRGQTPRNTIMFGGPGIFYVYFTYGMHYMLNIAAGPAGYPAAVLIRAVELSGQRRKKGSVPLSTNGPAKLTKTLKIDKSFNGLPAYIRKSGLWVETGETVPAKAIKRAKRIGVGYAGEYKDKQWRFYIKGNPNVSKK